MGARERAAGRMCGVRDAGCVMRLAASVQGGDLPVGFVGNRTDCAMLMVLRKWGVSYEEVGGAGGGGGGRAAAGGVLTGC